LFRLPAWRVPFVVGFGVADAGKAAMRRIMPHHNVGAAAAIERRLPARISRLSQAAAAFIVRAGVTA
jgi:hypothetical protein